MIVGIDIGTQSLKAVVLDDGLQVRGAAATAYEPAFPKPGWAEQDPGLWEAALAPTIARALESAGAGAGDIAGLGIGGQLDGCVAVDGTGEPVHPCLIWMDRRAEREVAGLPADDVRDRTGVILDASHMAAKIRWLKANVPAARGCLFHQPTSYLVHRLTGTAVMDHALASTSMLYGLGFRAFDPWLLEVFGIAAGELPALGDAAQTAGTLTARGATLTGLAEGTPVAIGTGDDFSTPLGAGIVAPGRLACVLGTAEVVGAVHAEPAIDGNGLVETHAYAGGGFFIENPGWLSGGALAWFRETFRLQDFRELDALADAVPPGADGVTFLPGLSGTMAPEWIASARGCFYGLTPAHGAGHMARAVLEGTAFAMRDVAERLTEMGVGIDAIRLLGGGAKSRTWARIRADLTGLPVELPEITDTAPIGAALLAAVAVGREADLMTAAEKIGGVAETVDPEPARKPAYDAAYGAYRTLFEALRPMY
ncbi:MAG: xylulokinase [Hyphomicrobiales bacterium]